MVRGDTAHGGRADHLPAPAVLAQDVPGKEPAQEAGAG